MKVETMEDNVYVNESYVSKTYLKEKLKSLNTSMSWILDDNEEDKIDLDFSESNIKTALNYLDCLTQELKKSENYYETRDKGDE